MDDVTDVARLAGEGVPIEIAGHSFTARFTMRSLKDLERDYGSLPEVGRLILQLSDPAQNTHPFYGTVTELLAVALRYERIDGEPLTEDWLLDHADPRRVVEYEGAVFRALMGAMPAPQEADPTTPARTPAKTTAKSRGARSSGSASSDVASVPTNSGTA